MKKKELYFLKLCGEKLLVSLVSKLCQVFFLTAQQTYWKHLYSPHNFLNGLS